MDLAEAYSLLELPFGASEQDVDEAERFLALAWHPDRFPSERWKARAATKLKVVFAAIDVIRETPRPHVDWEQSPPVPEPVEPEQQPPSPQPPPVPKPVPIELAPLDLFVILWSVLGMVVAFVLGVSVIIGG